MSYVLPKLEDLLRDPPMATYHTPEPIVRFVKDCMAKEKAETADKTEDGK